MHSMHIWQYELKKLLALPMFWIFLVLSLCLNTVIIWGYRYCIVDMDVLADVQKEETRDETGERLSELWGCENIYKNYDTNKLADAYIDMLGLTGITEKWVRKKYEKLQLAVNHLDKQEAAYDRYQDEETWQMHQLLFATLMRAIATEACLLAVLSMIYIFGYERQHRTEFTIYTTHIGRSIVRAKLVSGLAASGLAYIVVACMTLLMFCLAFDYSGVWSSSVSSGFNYVSEITGIKPFTTWIPLSVGQYLAIMLALIFVLVLVFGLIGAALGSLIRNTYLAAVCFFVGALGMLAAPYIFVDLGLWSGYFFAQMLPICLWFSLSGWLTDMSMVSLVPFHETVGICLNLIFWSGIVWLSFRRFNRRDIL